MFLQGAPRGDRNLRVCLCFSLLPVKNKTTNWCRKGVKEGLAWELRGERQGVANSWRRPSGAMQSFPTASKPFLVIWSQLYWLWSGNLFASVSANGYFRTIFCCQCIYHPLIRSLAYWLSTSLLNDSLGLLSSLHVLIPGVASIASHYTNGNYWQGNCQALSSGIPRHTITLPFFKM